MNKKYRLGNQSEEYELRTDYLGWKPNGLKDWYEYRFSDRFLSSESKAAELIIVNPTGSEEISLVVYTFIIKDAFPLEFFGEERARDWSCFCIVSRKENPEDKFIIPVD